jgi:hypothetical protein
MFDRSSLASLTLMGLSSDYHLPVRGRKDDAGAPAPEIEVPRAVPVATGACDPDRD